MRARAVLARGERDFAEVTGLNGRGDVGATDPAPPREVLGWNEDASVVARAAAGAAREAVELICRVAVAVAVAVRVRFQISNWPSWRSSVTRNRNAFAATPSTIR